MRSALLLSAIVCLAGCVSPLPRKDIGCVSMPTGWYVLGEDRPDYLYKNSLTNAPRLAVHDCAKLQLNTIPWDGNTRWETWIAPDGYVSVGVSSSNGNRIASVVVESDGTNVYLTVDADSRYRGSPQYVISTNDAGKTQIRSLEPQEAKPNETSQDTSLRADPERCR